MEMVVVIDGRETPRINIPELAPEATDTEILAAASRRAEKELTGFMVSRHEEMRLFYRWTTYTRSLALIITILLVIIGLAEPIVIAFVVVDAIGAAWTIWALRRDEEEPLGKEAC